MHNDAATIASFLSRPVVINYGTWTDSTEEDDIGDPLQLLLAIQNVKDKLNRFKLLRFDKMHIKITTTSTNFNYGLASLVFWPFMNDTWVPLRYNPGSIPLQYACTLPHVYITPSDGVGGEITIPWFYPTTFLDISTNSTKSSYIGNSSLIFRVFSELRSVGAANASPVNYTIYMWLENPDLSVPTQNSIVITPQADYTKHIKKAHSKVSEVLGKVKSKSEYSKMKASQIATSIADVAGSLSDIPIIGSFASATQAAAELGSSVLSWFGFSKPLTLDDLDRAKMVTSSSLSTYNGKDGAYKLALDDKQELTVDPRIVGGTGEDEMAFSYVFKKEGLIAQFVWPTSATHGNPLAILPVTPSMSTVVVSALDEPFYGVAPSPLTYASQPFAYWRGTIKYRIVIPSSPFIRGKLRVAYSPTFSNYTSTTDLTQITSNTIIDLSTTTTEVTIEIPWCQAREWAQRKGTIFTNSLGVILAPAPNTTNNVTQIDNNCNGMLIFQVIDPVVGPDTSVQVDVLVFMSGGDDFEVAEIHLKDIQRNLFSVANLNAVTPTYTKIFEYSDVTPQADIVLGDAHNVSKSGMLYFGEKITSIRQVLKRDYVTWASNIVLSASISHLRLLLPLYLTDYFSYYGGTPVTGDGYDDISPDDTDILLSTVAPNTPFLHYKMCYLAMRGGIRYRFDHAGNTGSASVSISNQHSNPTMNAKSVTATLESSPIEPLNWRCEGSSSGGMITCGRVAPFPEAEAPFYSNFMYTLASADGTQAFVDTLTNDSLRTLRLGMRNGISYTHRGTIATGDELYVYQGVAEDFSLMWFLLAPMHYEEKLTTGVPFRNYTEGLLIQSTLS